MHPPQELFTFASGLCTKARCYVTGWLPMSVYWMRFGDSKRCLRLYGWSSFATPLAEHTRVRKAILGARRAGTRLMAETEISFEQRLVGLMQRIDHVGGRLGEEAPFVDIPLLDGYAIGSWARARDLFSDVLTLTELRRPHGIAIITRSMAEESCQLWELEQADAELRFALVSKAFIDDHKKQMAVMEAFRKAGLPDADGAVAMKTIQRELTKLTKKRKRDGLLEGVEFKPTADVLSSRGCEGEVSAFQILNRFVHGGDYSHRLNREILEDGTWAFVNGPRGREDFGTKVGTAIALFATRCMAASDLSIRAIVGSPSSPEMISLQEEVEEILANAEREYRTRDESGVE